MDKSVEKAMFDRLQRIESRVVRGFTELGVVVCDDTDWIRVDVERREVHMKGLGRSIRAIQIAIINAGGYDKNSYRVFVGGEPVATVEM